VKRVVLPGSSWRNGESVVYVVSVEKLGSEQFVTYKTASSEREMFTSLPNFLRYFTERS
jgi:hypothetical protein